MRTSSAGLELIKTFEGLRETAVRLPDGRWTIGYGHVRTAREGLTITATDAETLLLHDLKPVEAAISALIYAPLMQGQFDALVSLAYNISLGQFRDSEIVGHLNAGNYLAAANGFDLWRRARLHGRVMVVDALVRRRAAEKALFLEHPSGPPSAPTPLVPPQLDTPDDDVWGGSRAEVEEEAEAEAPASGESISEIAEAVRRLATRMQGAVSPAPEIPLPPGAAVVTDAEPDPKPEPEPDTTIESVSADASAPLPEPDAEPVTAEQIARASRTMAERVSRILSGVQTRIDAQEAEQAADRPADQAPRQAPTVREGLPDFDLPAEGYSPQQIDRMRQFIDDTEVVDPGRDPSQLFAEAEQKAKVVNGQSRRVGPVSGRLLSLAPWIVVLALSVLGFTIGAVDTFKDNGAGAAPPQLAATIMAVFGIMTLMSLYYIFWKRVSEDA